MPGGVDSVALNALFLSPGDSGGPETYLRGLVRGLASEYPSLRMVLFTTPSGRRALAADGFGDLAELRSLPAEEYRRVRRQLCEQVVLPLAARRARVQLLHSVASVAPIRTPRLPAVITVHDVTFTRIATFGPVTTWGMRQVVGRAARRADSLLTGSAAARDEICAVLGLDPGRFLVVHHGVDFEPRAEPAAETAVRERLRLPSGRLVLCVGALRPHKNQEVLVRALPALPADATLVLAGREESYAETLRELARGLGVEDRVRLTGFVSDSELERLWRLAACAAFPTLGEGFGLPVAEAMARRLPVACSDIPVLREVGGEVPRYFDPRDPAAAASAVAEAMTDGSAAERGEERARRFTWVAAARGTMAAYERALAAGAA